VTCAVEALLDRLAELGASVACDSDRLRVRAGDSGIPAALIASLRAAKPDVIAVLSRAGHADRDTAATDRSSAADIAHIPVDRAWWRCRFAVRTLHWQLGDYRSPEKARCIAFGELLDVFREKHGRRWPHWQCAGCDAPIGGLAALTLLGGNRVHFDAQNECLIRFGRRWQGDAIAGLRALGLEPPPGFEPV